jgi:hypothetical protein
MVAGAKGVPSAAVKTIRGMAPNLIGCDREQEFLLPPSVREWLPDDHLAWFVIEAVAAMISRGSWSPIASMGAVGRRTIRR